MLKIVFFSFKYQFINLSRLENEQLIKSKGFLALSNKIQRQYGYPNQDIKEILRKILQVFNVDI